MITYNETNFLRKESLNREYLSGIKNSWYFNSYEYEVFMKKGKPKSIFIIDENGENIK